MTDAASSSARITGLTTRILRGGLPRAWDGGVRANHVVAVDVRCSDGVVGHGFSWTPRIGPRAVRSLLEHDLAPWATGRPADPETLWDDAWAYLHEGGGGGLTTIALAGLDLALWDAAGRRARAGVPDVVGRRTSDVATYASGVNLDYELPDLLDQVGRWVDDGFDAVKIKIGSPDLTRDVTRVRAVRDVLGPDRALMVDANQRWDLPTAQHAIDTLAAFDLTWVEEPLRADDTRGYAALARTSPVPLAWGENGHHVHRFRDMVDNAAAGVRILQPNIVRVGGYTPFLRIALEAIAAGIEVAPHLLPDLSAQAALTLPAPTRVESIDGAWLGDLGLLSAPSPVRRRGTRLEVARAPGWGLTFRGQRPADAGASGDATAHR
ncbi:Mandelate racemase/muconate lactonizing protein [Beutenbergia cavernae DSM 12333]|uniref:Mandelate racemase/muconate lactonizing protein n=1 Tax=Beutenbergia cavernae (strain ATCC BAA-8 / DSM 12333 / CCUG 43141 / JCM 11478 / NBRC 16432 / NCIMB 13614 / HKI 0122) TaxID=471853 RepID=C5BYU0_BEUC1|nr:mandelate racemase/muconate lactonizing enzyme family protein [Beutenbergia cavernae]ACQ79048.1 Mandelate racemase/muconate lactonizing protein [Beutenbergia cavernae DSM 12333]